MKKTMTIVALLLSSGLAFQACKKDDEAPAGSELPPITRIVTYEAEIADIASQNCTACHHSGSAPSGSLDLTTYDNFKASHETGNMPNRLVNSSDPMPPAGMLSASLRQIIDKWAADGYPEE